MLVVVIQLLSPSQNSKYNVNNGEFTKMYVITHHHDYDEVLLGPIEWNPRFIASVLQTDLDLPFKPDVKEVDKNRVPYEILPNVWARPVVPVVPEYDSKTQFLVGPYWSYTENEAIAEYRPEYKNLDLVKTELKQDLAAERYRKEVAGVKTTIQDVEVTVDTNRGDRDVFVQKFLLMGENDTVEWKFPEGWLTLTKSDLGAVVAAGVAHVQGAFSWELSKTLEIDAATTHEELMMVEIVEKKEEVVLTEAPSEE